ncbi:MAG: hypothetical protein ACJ798_11450 [Phenylobacterium sp.]
MVRRPAVLLLLALAALAAGVRAETPPPRAELPIRANTLSNGAVRYGVPIRIGGKTLDAALDTGSTGLRILPGVLGPADAVAGAEAESYGYASGSRYEGVAGVAQVTLGAISARAPLHLIASIGCFVQLPHCPASRTPLPHYGIASDGLPDEGFKAILGTDMDRARVGNPLVAMGVRRWIVELPRPGDAGPGRLVLNPTPEETEGYVMLPLAGPYAQIQGGGLHDALPGCLVHAASQARVCGPVLMDTGSSFLAVANGRRGAAWADGGEAALELYGVAGQVAARTAFVLGSRERATRLNWRDEPRAPGTVIFAGAAPYFAWSVLYDARRQQIGLKPRRPPAGP